MRVHRKLDWNYWSQILDTTVALWEIVALSLKIEPRNYHNASELQASEATDLRIAQEVGETAKTPFTDRLHIAIRHLGGALRPAKSDEDIIKPPERRIVDLREFITLAVSMGWNLPPELKAISGTKAGRPEAEGTRNAQLQQAANELAESWKAQGNDFTKRNICDTIARSVDWNVTGSTVDRIIGKQS